MGQARKYRFATPQEAEAAFYDAFEQRNLDGMMQVWDDDDTIVCIHPMGQRLEAYQSIREGWHQIFAAGSLMHFTVSEQIYIQDAQLAIHMVQEHILLDDEEQPRPPVYSTNIYRLGESGWHMILHHASPSPPGDTSGQGISGDILH